MSNTIKSWNLFKGMTDNDIRRILDRSENKTYKSGEILCKQGDSSESMYIILSGRVQIQMVKQDGQLQNLNVLAQGTHFGELSLLTGSPRMATAIAIMDTTVVEISNTRFKRLIHEIPTFSINLSNTIGTWLKGELSGKPVRHKLAIVGFIRTTPLTYHLTTQISDWLIANKKRITVFTDRLDYWQTQNQSSVKLHPILLTQDELTNTIKKLGSIQTNKHLDNKPIKNENPINEPIDEQYDHVIIDISISPNENNNILATVLNQCERIWYLTDKTHVQTLENNCNSLINKQESLASKIQIAWIRPKHENNLSPCKHKLKTEHIDMHCQYDSETQHIRNQDLSRIYHDIIGVHIGIALGGGGARSLAHIGVLAALNDNEIYVDRMAGTSGGAIISSFYAAGYSLQSILKIFKQEMSPPKWMRYIPYATRWHLMSLFRFGLLDDRFRHYLKKHTFEQLLIPTHLVCADLISGDEIIRSNGNIVDAILESINHPLLGTPIYRDGLSLVDGGVLNNVPSSVLRNYKCDFVISVDVGAKISETFGKNSSRTAQSEMKKVSFLGTLNRVLEIRGNGLDKSTVNHGDFLIQPDASKYPFDDFTYEKELYEIGYTAAMEAMPELKRRYYELIES